MHNYLMVGAGGTGSMLLAPLHRYLSTYHKTGDWMLYILDGDVVEEKNLARQLFAPGDITANKAIAAEASLRDSVHVKAYPEYLSEENMERFVQNTDTVLICVDNMTVRKRIEERALALDYITVINGGNEKYDGSVQLWVRERGLNITPRLSYLHPEVAVAEGEDRAEMTCAQAAALPGGEQTIIANLQSATWMLTALWRKHSNLHTTIDEPKAATWTELQFDPIKGRVDHIDQRFPETNWSAS
jgi:molybdopterin/thiamine biosynthesis adenylyltransferase